MKGKTVLITGAGSGVGRGLACDFGAKGLLVLATDLNGETAQETAEIITSAGGRADGHKLDVTKSGSIAAVLSAAGGDGVDILINNAGLQYVSPIESFSEDKWNLLIDVMLNGVCRMTKAVLPGMRAKGLGRIINIGSIHSLVASPFKSAYIAAKHGLLGFSKTIALETAAHDITINTICPSYILTPLVEQQITAQAASHGISEEEVKEQIMLKPMPKKAFVSIPEIMGTIEFLCSDLARNITAQSIAIDGGWTAQ